VDRDKQLEACLASVEKAHDYKPDIPVEILVVIQKSAQAKNIRVGDPARVAFYYIDKIGLSVARNFAIAKSTGDFLVFLDDDAQVSPDFIDVLSRQIAAHGRVNAFCGRLIDPIQNVAFTHLFNNTRSKSLGRLDYQYFMGSAHVLSKEIINKIGGYDERFGVGAKYYGSEESDIFFRLKAAKEEVLYLPDLIFLHPIPCVPAVYVYRYAYAVGAVLTKNCINDKAHFIVYWLIVLQRLLSSSIRILQKIFLRGIYLKKDAKYHYGSLFKGTLKGIYAYAQD
jgi:glycosyltransferase involved in cell wall biosynthesis